MHSGVRGATELLQQEVGQAGRIALPGRVTLGAAITGVSPCTVPVAATVTSTTGMFVGQWLTTLDEKQSESVTITAIPSTTTFMACFTRVARGDDNDTHGVRRLCHGHPPSDRNRERVDREHVEDDGDIDGNGSMVYVEYHCDNGDAGTAGSFNLYRNAMPFTTAAASKPPRTDAMIMLSSVHTNPVDVSGAARPCFQYQTASVTVNGTPYTFVLDVAVTLTVWTQSIDSITRQFQAETKALLNVSPRNVFFTWEFAGLGYTNRIQPTPPTVSALTAVLP